MYKAGGRETQDRLVSSLTRAPPCPIESARLGLLMDAGCLHPSKLWGFRGFKDVDRATLLKYRLIFRYRMVFTCRH